MTKQVLLYGRFDSETVTEFIEEINEVVDENAEAEITVRINTVGGEPEYAWGAIARFNELKGKKSVKNDGQAHSMGLFFNCYCKDREALDVTEFLLHRCAYPSWIESNPDYFDDAKRGNLERVNKSLQKALENTVDVTKLEAIMAIKTGKPDIKVKDIFSIEGRVEVYLTAAEAKKIGLIDRVIKITPEKTAEINSLKESKNFTPAKAAQSEFKTKTMTKEELQQSHPGVYNAIFNEGKIAGHTAMKEVAEVWAHYASVDAKMASEGISKGVAPTPLQIIELTEKKFSKASLKDIENDNAKETPTETPEEKTKKEAEIADFKKGVMANSQYLKG
jgi:ATP-dependent protease ClpP protease subunit